MLSNPVSSSVLTRTISIINFENGYSKNCHVNYSHTPLFIRNKNKSFH